ncbi:hypothetical protein HCK00_11645 [Streptomyces sp. PLAI1-29]|uniref:Four-carbon acid sugar kinase nucleotide binding domain-containing protein n=2 Tax=Streptomyces zingiberis TaxID=2053010 RepID=A0ABX1BXL3_9ACTN|nr:hypothetical protein [Streptomyces zingiberis]
MTPGDQRPGDPAPENLTSRHLAPGHPAREVRESGDGGSPGDRPLLVVVGTAELTAPAQIAQLAALGAEHRPLPAAVLTSAGGPPPTAPPGPGVTVVSVDASDGVDPGRAHQVSEGLAAAVRGAAAGADLVLTGGETARRVLDALGVTALTPEHVIHPGAVHCRTDDGRSVVTRPGSHGGTDSLLRITRALRPGFGQSHEPRAPRGARRG